MQPWRQKQEQYREEEEKQREEENRKFEKKKGAGRAFGRNADRGREIMAFEEHSFFQTECEEHLEETIAFDTHEKAILRCEKIKFIMHFKFCRKQIYWNHRQKNS